MTKQIRVYTQQTRNVNLTYVCDVPDDWPDEIDGDTELTQEQRDELWEHILPESQGHDKDFYVLEEGIGYK